MLSTDYEPAPEIHKEPGVTLFAFFYHKSIFHFHTESNILHEANGGKVSSSFLTPLTSCKADKVGTLVFTLRLGIMPGLPSSMMPKVPKYGLCPAFLKVVIVFEGKD